MSDPKRPANAARRIHDAPLSAKVPPMKITETPMQCAVSPTDVYRMIDGYFEGIDVERRRRLEAHLDSCTGCGDVYNFQRQLRSVVETGCREELPDDVRQRVLDSINQLLD